jgi:predicted metal-dependent peptidase
MQVTSDRLKNLIARFVLKYNYWGYLFSRIRRQADSNLPSIMGVGPEPDGTICLYYNPVLVDGTDDVNVTKVIEHEGMHLLDKHIPRSIKIMSNETNPQIKNIKFNIWNQAADCGVNQQAKFKNDFIINGKKWPICLPETMNLPENKISEWYYLELLKHINIVKITSGGKNGNGKGGGDGKNPIPGIGDHGKWKSNLKGVADLDALARKVEQHVRRLVKDSVKTFNKDRGRLPAHIAELIDKNLAPPKAPYYQIIRKLVRGSRLSKFKRSPTRINRKRTYAFYLKDLDLPQMSPFPGKQRDFTFDIVILLDTSGSMSDNDVKEGLSGVKNILEKDRHCYTTILEVDDGVEKEYVCKRVHDIQFTIKGRGGTTLGPGLERARELRCDVCLVFTDGFTENINMIPRKKLPKKIIWVIGKNGTAQNVNQTGFVVHI